MPGGFTQQHLDEIRSRVDIVEIVGQVVKLKRAGENWKGLCPFHTEKTASFTVNPKRNIYHCFGCGAGGDAFSFLMRQERVAFPEAVRSLAERAGVTLPEAGGRSPETDNKLEALRRVMALAAEFYVGALWERGGEKGRTYLEQRGVDPEMARRFGLGYAPEGWNSLLSAMARQGISEDLVVQAGLALPRQNQPGFYDRFRGRLLFSIRDVQGRVVAFGGRALSGEEPKYLNSPETALYVKGQMLYALDVARTGMRERGRAILVEGYLDCLMAHQHGFGETVAALGTAFTTAQLGLLRRYADEVVALFDADAAGQKAAARAEELLEPTGRGMAWAVNRSGAFEGAGTLKVKVALLPAGHDPDTFLRSAGSEGFNERIGAARSILSYALDRALVDPDGATGARARTTAFARVALLLAKVADGDEAAALSREAATRLGVDPTQLWIESQRLQTSLRTPPVQSRPPAAASMPPVERDLVTLLLHSEEARTALLAPLGESDEVGHASLRAIVEALRRRPDAPAESLMTDLPTDEARSVLSSLLVEDRESVDARVSIGQFQRRLERSQRLRRAREMSQVIAETQAKTGVAAPMDAELRTLHKESAVVYEITGGVAQSLEHGTSQSPRSSDE